MGTPERNISFHSNLPTNFRQSIFKMGVGRRMKKQGMPEPLDEAHFTNLKRKAGMSVTESRAESLQYASSKRRRKQERRAKLEKNLRKGNLPMALDCRRRNLR